MPAYLADDDLAAMKWFSGYPENPSKGPSLYLRADRGQRRQEWELNGAFSNPRLQLELPRLREVHDPLLAQTASRPRSVRPAPPRTSPVLETITTVLASTRRPMRIADIHAAAEQLAGTQLLRTSVKAALAAGTSHRQPRFRRVHHGVYQSAHDL